MRSGTRRKEKQAWSATAGRVHRRSITPGSASDSVQTCSPQAQRKHLFFLSVKVRQRCYGYTCPPHDHSGALKGLKLFGNASLPPCFLSVTQNAVDTSQLRLVLVRRVVKPAVALTLLPVCTGEHKLHFYCVFSDRI